MLARMTTAAPSQTPPRVRHAARPPSPPARATISRAAAARRLDVAERTIDRYVERGLLVAHRDRISRRVGIEVAGLDAIEAQRVIIDE